MERTPASQQRVPRCAVPQGHVLVSHRILNSPLYEALKGCGVKLVVEERLYHVDCYVSNDTGVLFLDANAAIEVQSNDALKKSLNKLSKSSVSGIVLVHCTDVSRAFFNGLQDMLVFDYGLRVLPVESVQEAARITAQLAKKSPGNSNPFDSTKPLPALDPLVLQAVQVLPRTGSTNSRNLLKKFGSVRGITDATTQEISEVTGKANAATLNSFLS